MFALKTMKDRDHRAITRIASTKHRHKNMKYNPQKHHRRSIRLKDYDYSQSGAYFITICTHDRECLFGEIVNGEMRLNDGGQMAQTVWEGLPKHYTGIDIDKFVVMPNHFHGIILIHDVGAGPCACPHKGQTELGQPRGVAPTMSLPDVVHRFKSLTTTRYRQGVNRNGWLPFPGKLWQRNYHEHIIRDENELLEIREYIANNPSRWAEDENNPINIKEGQSQLGRPTGSPLQRLIIKQRK